MYICVCVYMYVCIYVYLCVRIVYVCIYMYIHTCMYIYICTTNICFQGRKRSHNSKRFEGPVIKSRGSTNRRLYCPGFVFKWISHGFIYVCIYIHIHKHAHTHTHTHTHKTHLAPQVLIVGVDPERRQKHVIEQRQKLRFSYQHRGLVSSTEVWGAA